MAGSTRTAVVWMLCVTGKCTISFRVGLLLLCGVAIFTKRTIDTIGGSGCEIGLVSVACRGRVLVPSSRSTACVLCSFGRGVAVTYDNEIRFRFIFFGF